MCQVCVYFKLKNPWFIQPFLNVMIPDPVLFWAPPFFSPLMLWFFKFIFLFLSKQYMHIFLKSQTFLAGFFFLKFPPFSVAPRPSFSNLWTKSFAFASVSLTCLYYCLLVFQFLALILASCYGWWRWSSLATPFLAPSLGTLPAPRYLLSNLLL